MEQDCVLIRYGEIALKGNNRSMFERKLRDNIRRTLDVNGINAKVQKISGRFIAETREDKAAVIISKVFGVTSASPAIRLKADLDEIKKKALELLNEKKPASFRITTNRLEKEFKKNSQEVNQLIGEFVQNSTKCKVSLKNPELEIGVELTKNHAYLCVERMEGVGGLPVGVSGKVVSLLSGGIDSPVAAYLALKRGCDVTLVHFLHESHDKKPRKIEELKKRLCEYYPDLKLLYVPTNEIEREIVMNSPSKLRIILLRRMFMRMASSLCRSIDAKAIVTGDNIGQVASQTLDNLNVIDHAAEFLTIRPLAGWDKNEIVGLSRKIGTYELSVQDYKDCCNFLLPKHPETKATIKEVEFTERNFDLSICEKALEKAYEA